MVCHKGTGTEKVQVQQPYGIDGLWSGHLDFCGRPVGEVW
jgi:hypothetical protein